MARLDIDLAPYKAKLKGLHGLLDKDGFLTHLQVETSGMQGRTIVEKSYGSRDAFIKYGCEFFGSACAVIIKEARFDQ